MVCMAHKPAMHSTIDTFLSVCLPVGKSLHFCDRGGLQLWDTSGLTGAIRAGCRSRPEGT